jgi:hypothetical protein
VGAVATGAQIILVISKDVTLLAQATFLVDNNLADIVSVSFSQCESPLSTSFSTIWEQAAAQGVTVFVSTGDNGSANCDDPNKYLISQQGYAVNEIASTPYNVAVGGTEFYEEIGSDSTYWSTSNYVTSAGLNYTSALRYIPEVVWNESSDNGGNGISAGGGGVSKLYPTPPWQAGIGLPPTSLISPFPTGFQGQPRYLPDVSLNAAGHDGYLLCTETVPLVGNCWTKGPATALPLGGTSIAVPAFAGIQALIDQRYGRQGQAAYVYYNLAAAEQDLSACSSLRPGGPDPGCIFNDITLGYNGVPCQIGAQDPFCTTGVLPNFVATTGYDPATGLGSVNALNLLEQWDKAIFRSTKTTLQVTNPGGGVANFGQPVTLTASVYVPSNQASSQEWDPPLEGWNVMFWDATNSAQLGNATLEYGASASDFVATFSTSSLSVGVHSITATFPGNLSSMYYGTSTSIPVAVTVQQQSTLPTLTGLTVTPSTVTLGASATVTATLSGPAPSGGAQVSLTSSNPTAFPAPSSFIIPAGQTSGSSSPIVAGAVSANTTVVVNGAYNSGFQQASVVVNPSANIALTIVLSASQTTVNAGQSVNLTATFTGATKGTPTGLAYFYDNFNGVATNIGNVSISTGGQYSATFSTGSLLAGQHAFTVIYNGDSNYSSAISNVVNVTAQQQSQESLVLSNFTITPATIVGGYSPQGNVFLTGNAPAGGAVVSITSTDNHSIQVPPTVTVSPGYNSRAFPITTSFTSGTVGATITASYNGTMYGAGLTVLPVAVSGVTFYPSTVTAGNSAPLTVYLTGPAAAGTSVSLTSSNPSLLQVPSTVQLTTGATSASVTGTTSAVGSQTTVTVTASYNNSSAQGALTVLPAPPLAVNSLNFSPSTVTGGNSASGQVTLTALAPTGGVNVALNSASGLVQVPSTVFVPAGAWYAPVTAETSTVNSVTNVTVKASYGGSSQNATLTLVPPLPFLASLSLNPILVNSGSSVAGTVTLTAPPPLDGIGGVVNLTSNASYAVAHVPQNVIVQTGNTSANFTITTSPISFIAPVTITASYNGTSQSVLLTIVPSGTPLAPSLLTLNPPTVTGGSTSTGTVMLTGPAPAEGAVLTVSSDNSAVQVPPETTIPPGASSMIFSVTTSNVPVISTATITATLNGVSQSSLLTVNLPGASASTNPVPFLTSPLMPVSQTPGGAGFSFNVDGVGFVPGAQVLWNGTALPTSFVSGSQVQATVSPTSIQTNGSTLVTVTNPGQEVLSSNPLPEHLTYPTPSPAFSVSSLPVSGSPMTVVTGDFNGDGKLDLVIGKSDGSGLSIFLGNGDGTFGPERIVSSIYTSPVAVGDLNGDGKLDVVFNKSTTSSGIIGILLGNGDGTFTAMPDISLPSSPSINAALALGDLNGDGSLDLVVTGNYLTQAYVLLGNGDGTFGSPAGFGSVNQPLSVGLGDFNGDGKLDIALPDFVNKAVAVLFGNGNGTFQSQQEYPTNGYAGSIAVADFDGDGHPDIAVANEGPFGSTGSGIVILRNNGNGTFALSQPNGVGLNFYYLAVDDLNGDGKLDLLSVIFQPSRQALLFLGNGDGTFSSTPVTIPVTNPASIAVADINADGAPDIFVPNSASSGGVSILLQSIGPIIGVAPSNLSFAATQGGANTSPIGLTISNTGGGTETWSATTSQTWLLLSQPSGTAPSTIDVTVNPTGLDPGTYNATITITATGASNSPQTVQVTLIVNPVPVVVSSLAFSPTALVGPGTSTGTVNLSAPAPVGGATVSLLSDNPAVRVPSTTSVNAGLSFAIFTASASAVATQTSATVTATYNGVSTASTLTVNPGSPAVTLSNTTLSFMNQLVGTTTMIQTVTVTNNGTANLTITSVALTGTNASDFAKSADTCSGAAVVPSGTCGISVTFTPSAIGSRTASLSLTDNASGNPQTIGLSGTGVAPAVSISSLSLEFSDQLINTASSPKTETVTNTGTANLTITTVTISGTNAGDFAKSADNCAGATVVPNGSCSVSVTFTPKAKGTRTASLTITDNAAGSPQSANLNGSGTAATPTITWPAPAAIPYGTALSSTQLDATASVPGSFVYTPPAGTVLSTGTQTLSVTFTPTDTTY